MAWGPLLPLLGGQAEKSSGIWGSAGYLGESGACRGHGRGEPRPQAGPDLASEKEYLLFGITCVCVRACVLSCFSCVRLFATPWTVARQAPLSMGFSRQEHWSGLHCPPPGHLPDSGIAPMSPALQAGRFFTAEPPGKAHRDVLNSHAWVDRVGPK